MDSVNSALATVSWLLCFLVPGALLSWFALSRCRQAKAEGIGVFVWYQVLWIAFAALCVLLLTGKEPIVKAPSFAWFGTLSPWVLLGGLLGGSTISLVGVAHHAHEWDGARYAFWHLTRPLLGMLTGSIAVLILLFVLQGMAPRSMTDGTSGSTVFAVDGTKPFTDGALAFMFVVAFIVGYREASFRELVKRVVDLLFVKPAEEATPFTVGFLPISLKLTSDGTSAASGILMLANSTSDAVSGPVVLSVAPGDEFSLTPTTIPSLEPGQGTPLTVKWQPGALAAGKTVQVNATAGDRRFSATVTGIVAPARGFSAPQSGPPGTDEAQFETDGGASEE